MKANDKTTYFGELAFICTVFNESGALIPFLISLIKQTVLPSEIIIVDGGSSDDTLAVIKDFFRSIEKTPGFKTTILIDTCREGTLPQAMPSDRKEADSYNVPYGNEKVSSNILQPGSDCNSFNDSAASLSGRMTVSESKNKSGNIDYTSEKLVFESIINDAARVKIYDAPGANISSGRNIAIKNAGSKYICVSDAGCRLSPDWIEEISKYFTCNQQEKRESDVQDKDCMKNSVSADISSGTKIETGNKTGTGIETVPRVNTGTETKIGTGIETENMIGTSADPVVDNSAGIVAGGYNFPYIENFLQACLAVCVLPVKSEIIRSKYMPSSRNISFAKSAWEKAKGYPQNMDFGEDMRFNFNLKALGYKIWFNPDALVYWNLRNSLKAIFRQFFRYAKGDAVGRMYSHRHLIRFASVFLLAALILAVVFVSLWFLPAIFLLFAAFIYRPYFRISYFLNDKNCCVFTENKKILLITKIKTIFTIPLMLPFIETAKLAGFIYGLFIRKNF